MIEDSEDDATLVLEALARDGYAVGSTRVETADALADAMVRGPWDLVTSDWSLPRFSGRAAVEMARARLPGVPIVVVSGTTDEHTTASAIEAGAAAFVPKSDLPRLARIVEQLLRTRDPV